MGYRLAEFRSAAREAGERAGRVLGQRRDKARCGGHDSHKELALSDTLMIPSKV
jgi:hypothetical protein